MRGNALNRHTVTVALLWVVLTAVSEALAIAFVEFPVSAAREGRVIDDAFKLQTLLAIPVFTFVIAALVYSVLAFRRRGDTEEDGPPVRTHRAWVGFWFVWTTALVTFVIIHPGFTGLSKIRAGASEKVDVTVQATGAQWLWQFKYPDQDITTINEIVLPVGKNIKFEVRSNDVLHSAWVPAFRMKIAAVPGITTHMYGRSERTGTFDDDYKFRMQCAELCGLSHATMFARVRVLEQDEFDAWVASKTAAVRSAN